MFPEKSPGKRVPPETTFGVSGVTGEACRELVQQEARPLADQGRGQG